MMPLCSVYHSGKDGTRQDVASKETNNDDAAVAKKYIAGGAAAAEPQTQSSKSE